MKIYFDTEFTGLHKNTTLISIGLVSDDGKSFYAEFIDYDKSQTDEWIEKNVIGNLKHINGKIDPCVGFDNYSNLGDLIKIRSDLLIWLTQWDTIEWVSDVCHYDFVLLIDLVYGHALNMPYGKHNAACHDINQDIANFYKISEIEAFDLSREQILANNSISIDGEKHNSLYDAKVIKEIYCCINNSKSPKGGGNA